MQQGKYTMFMRLHPFVNVVYFLGMMVFTMLYMDPLLLGVTGVICFFYLVYLEGIGGFKENLTLLPFILLLGFVNPVFNHNGRTVLFRIKGIPFTLEAFFFGLVSAVMIYDMILLFRIFHMIMTSDKIIVVFSKVFPTGALLFTMVLRFVPMYKLQIQRMHAARIGIGQSGNEKKKLQKIRNGVELISGLFTWSLENALETADSMKGRGFGLKGRTFYLRTKLTRADISVLIWEAVCVAGMVYGAVNRAYHVVYYPVFQWNKGGMADVAGYVFFTAFAGIPLLLDGKEEVTWKCLRQKI